MGFASDSSTQVEHLLRHPKVGGSNPATATGTWNHFLSFCFNPILKIIFQPSSLRRSTWNSRRALKASTRTSLPRPRRSRRTPCPPRRSLSRCQCYQTFFLRHWNCRNNKLVPGQFIMCEHHKTYLVLNRTKLECFFHCYSKAGACSSWDKLFTLPGHWQTLLLRTVQI